MKEINIKNNPLFDDNIKIAFKFVLRLQDKFENFVT